MFYSLTIWLSTNQPTRQTNIHSSKTLRPTIPHWKYWYCPYYPSYLILCHKSDPENRIQQAYDIISISEKYIAHHSSILWYSIKLRALSKPYFDMPLIFYQFQSNIKPSIHLAYDILLISEHCTAHNSTSLWSSINFRAKYSPSFINPLIFFQFQSIIQPSIQQASYLLSNAEQYNQKCLHSTLTNSNSFFIHEIKTRIHISSI